MTVDASGAPRRRRWLVAFWRVDGSQLRVAGVHARHQSTAGPVRQPAPVRAAGGEGKFFGIALAPRRPRSSPSATASTWRPSGSTGWPYIQHRGGPTGFLKVIDEETIAFADFAGNKQYISVGNLATDDRVALILVDYPRQARLKILGRARTLEGEQAKDWLDRVRDPGTRRPSSGSSLIHVEAFDWNCQQHITPRFTVAEIEEACQAQLNRGLSPKGVCVPK